MNPIFIELKKLLSVGGLPELGPGPRAGVLSVEKVDGLLTNFKTLGKKPELIRALLYLWQDQMDAAHAIAQEVENPDGSLVHAILHRREPDYGNATYWFRRVGKHACFPALAQKVTALLESKNETSLSAQLIKNGEWDPYAFISLCENSIHKPAGDERVKLLREIQGIETEVLLEYLSDATT